jgi:hypothetical protein
MVMIAGFYICLPVAWVLRREIRRAAATIMAGCVITSVVTIPGTAAVLTMTTG